VHEVISEAHSAYLAAAAVSIEVALEAGVRSVLQPQALPHEFTSWKTQPDITPGILFQSQGPTGTLNVQYRPDTPPQLEGDERSRKYLFAKDSRPVLAIHPRMLKHLGAEQVELLFVEGTKQHLAAVSAAPDGVLVIGLAGCHGWRTDGKPLEDFNGLPIEGSAVTIAFDADIATNRSVHDSGVALGEHLGLLGASSVKYLKTPTGAKAGLDDYLAVIPADEREAVLRRLIDQAGTIGKTPAKKAAKRDAAVGDEFFSRGSLLAVDLAEAFLKDQNLALSPDGTIFTYRKGIFRNDPQAVTRRLVHLVGNRWRGSHQSTVLEIISAALALEGKVLPEAPIGDLVAVQNGMLDVRTGELLPHHPKHLAYAQLAIDWNPGATSPNLDKWMDSYVGSQTEALFEAVGLCFAPWVGQRKVVFLLGPTRSGKGTYMRLMEGLIPEEHRSAQTLHSISNNRFSAAALHGKILNSAGDLSDKHIDDLSLFKSLTGDDLISGEHKFRDPFTFRNTALFFFNANNAPTVSENSRAYFARVAPFVFPHSYEGQESQAVEDKLQEELEGFLVHLVAGVQRYLNRGGYEPPNLIVRDLFAQQSDSVAQFASQALNMDAKSFLSTTRAHHEYQNWALANTRKPVGKQNFLKRLDNHLGVRERERTDGKGQRGWRGWAVILEEDQSDFALSYSAAAESLLSLSATSATFSPTIPNSKTVKEAGKEERESKEEKVGTKVAEVAEALDEDDLDLIDEDEIK